MMDETPWPQIRTEIRLEVSEALSFAARDLDLLGALPVVEVATEERTSTEMTARALDETEGNTERRELAEGKCQGTWRSYPHEFMWGDPTVYRQHRCGRELHHRGHCRCRYCGKDGSAA